LRGKELIPELNTTNTQKLKVVMSEFLATDPEVLGSIPGDTRFSEK
jgi:hypothetical protein